MSDTSGATADAGSGSESGGESDGGGGGGSSSGSSSGTSLRSRVSSISSSRSRSTSFASSVLSSRRESESVHFSLESISELHHHLKENPSGHFGSIESTGTRNCIPDHLRTASLQGDSVGSSLVGSFGTSELNLSRNSSTTSLDLIVQHALPSSTASGSEFSPSDPVPIPPGGLLSLGLFTPPASVSPSSHSRGAKRDPIEALLRLDRLKMSCLKQRSKGIVIPHVRQRRNWDCGLACVEMILRSKGDRAKGLEREAGTNSIWTIDLAFLLWNRNLAVDLFTTSPGVREEYAGFNFYADVWEDDAERVDTLYSRAFQDPILSKHVHVRSLSDEDMIQYLVSGKHALIVLVDSMLLRCTSCGKSQEPRLGSNHSRASEYAGHFVVAVDYDAESRMLYYRNPDSADALCSISVSAFREARSAQGTDDDVLVVSL